MRGAYRIPEFTDEATKLGREVAKLLISKAGTIQIALDALDAAEHSLLHHARPVSAAPEQAD